MVHVLQWAMYVAVQRSVQSKKSTYILAENRVVSECPLISSSAHSNIECGRMAARLDSYLFCYDVEAARCSICLTAATNSTPLASLQPTGQLYDRRAGRNV